MIWNSTTKETIENTEFITLKSLVSEKARKLLWGAGYLLNGEDGLGKERLEGIFEFNSFLDLMNSVEINLSERLEGNQGLAIIPFKNNIRLDLIDMDSSIFSWAQNGEMIEARTNKFVKYGIYQYNITQVWSRTRMKTIVNRQSPEGVISMTGAQFNNEVPESYRVLDSWDYSELGFIPIFTFTNKGSIGGTDYGDGYMVRNLQLMLNQITKNLFKESEYNRTRVLGSPNANQVRYADGGGVDYSMLNSDMFYNLGQDSNPDKPLLEILQGDPKLMQYQDTINEIINQYMSGCGYSGEGDSETNRTSSGTLFSKTGDIETTGIKRRVRETQLKDFLELIVNVDILYGIGNVYDYDGYSITLLENKVFDKATQAGDIQLAAQLGYLTEDRAISVLYNTDNQKEIDDIKEKLKVERENKVEGMEVNVPNIENGLTDPDKEGV